jgi:hypothetical protein
MTGVNFDLLYSILIAFRFIKSKSTCALKNATKGSLNVSEKNKVRALVIELN